MDPETKETKDTQARTFPEKQVICYIIQYKCTSNHVITWQPQAKDLPKKRPQLLADHDHS